MRTSRTNEKNDVEARVIDSQASDSESDACMPGLGKRHKPVLRGKIIFELQHRELTSL